MNTKNTKLVQKSFEDLRSKTNVQAAKRLATLAPALVECGPSAILQ